MFAKRTLLVVPLILVFCLIGCSNPSGSDNGPTTYYSVDAYEISADCYHYLKEDLSVEEVLTYVESQDGELVNHYSGETIVDFRNGLEDIGFKKVFVSECVEWLQREGEIAIWYESESSEYWMLYAAKE